MSTSTRLSISRTLVHCTATASSPSWMFLRQAWDIWRVDWGARWRLPSLVGTIKCTGGMLKECCPVWSTSYSCSCTLLGQILRGKYIY